MFRLRDQLLGTVRMLSSALFQQRGQFLRIKKNWDLWCRLFKFITMIAVKLSIVDPQDNFTASKGLKLSRSYCGTNLRKSFSSPEQYKIGTSSKYSRMDERNMPIINVYAIIYVVLISNFSSRYICVWQKILIWAVNQQRVPCGIRPIMNFHNIRLVFQTWTIPTDVNSPNSNATFATSSTHSDVVLHSFTLFASFKIQNTFRPKWQEALIASRYQHVLFIINNWLDEDYDTYIALSSYLCSTIETRFILFSVINNTVGHRWITWFRAITAVLFSRLMVPSAPLSGQTIGADEPHRKAVRNSLFLAT